MRKTPKAFAVGQRMAECMHSITSCWIYYYLSLSQTLSHCVAFKCIYSSSEIDEQISASRITCVCVRACNLCNGNRNGQTCESKNEWNSILHFILKNSNARMHCVNHIWDGAVAGNGVIVSTMCKNVCINFNLKYKYKLTYWFFTF